MQLILLSLFAWVLLSVPVALFIGRLCRFNDEWDEERDSTPVDASPGVGAAHVPLSANAA